MRKEIFRARKIPRNKLLDKKKTQEKDNKLTVNFTYFPVFRHLKSQLKQLQVTLACDEGHENIFTDESIIGFKNCSPRY